ncbi:hypothetical protein Dcar01_00232 [Deinococcus carri]|uniref:WD40 repeat domain-containing protein n=1 Tax=Deinococcus carri TaxID=1211323 RepID=A0ABP9W3E8_9DEIO
MPRLLPTAALLALGLTAAAVAVQPAWTLKKTSFLGFTDRGEVVTRAGAAPVLERRDPRTGEVLGTVVFPEAGNDLGLLAFTPDRKTQAWLNRAGDRLTVRTPAGRWEASLPGVRGTQALVFSPDGRTLAAMNAYGYVQLWDVAGGKRRATLRLHSQPRSLTFHPSRPLLAVNEALGAGSVTLWNTDTGHQVLTVPGLSGVLHPFQFAPDGTLLAGVGYSAGFLQLGLDRLGQGDWGVSLRKLPTYTEPCPPRSLAKVCARGVRSASFNADGSRVLLNISRTVQNIPAALLYDSKTGRLLKTIDGTDAWATLTPDGRGLILNNWEGKVQGAPLP